MSFETEVSRHFSMRAERYDSCGNWVRNEGILNAMISEFPIAEGRTFHIVDLGTGTGAVATHILNNYKGIASLSVVDLCTEMLDKITDSRITKYEASLENLPFKDNSFDIIVSRQCLHYVENLETAMKEIKRILKPGGLMILGQIVPLENHYKEYWDKIMKLRQPLRKRSYSETDWLRCFCDAGFVVRSVQNLQNRGSVSGWIKKYNVSDKKLIDQYSSMFLNAPEEFLKSYNVEIEESNVKYTTYWSILTFELGE